MRLLAGILAASGLAAALLATTPSLAADQKLTGVDGLVALELCRAAYDEDDLFDANVVDEKGAFCCSRELGYCIDCPRGSDTCTKTTYSTRPVRDMRPTAPNQELAPPGQSDQTRPVLTPRGTLPNMKVAPQ